LKGLNPVNSVFSVAKKSVNMVKIKICGITNEKDALWAANMGVDFLGLNFYKNSPRKISFEMACRITSTLPDFVKSVGVFVDEEIKTILKIVQKVRLKMVQLHGTETPQYCEELKLKITDSVQPDSLWSAKTQIIKAFRIGNGFNVEQIPAYKDADCFLLDAMAENLEGGTGQTFNWDIALEIKKFGKPIFLAGGLSPENVTEAVRKVEPYAVDVCSGVERSPTRKDHDKMHMFVKSVRGM